MTAILPKVGQRCEIEVDNGFIRSYIDAALRPAHPPTLVFRGTVLEPPAWMRDCFVMLDDSGQTRYINPLKIVRCGNQAVVAPQPSKDRVVTFASDRTGETYTARQDGTTKRWSCTCKGFEFRRSCKHILEAGNSG